MREDILVILGSLLATAGIVTVLAFIY